MNRTRVSSKGAVRDRKLKVHREEQMSSVTTRAQSRCWVTGASLSPDWIHLIHEKPYLRRLLENWASKTSTSTWPDGSPIEPNDPIAVAARGATTTGAIQIGAAEGADAAHAGPDDLSVKLQFIAGELSSLALSAMSGLIPLSDLQGTFVYAKALLMWAINLNAHAALEQAVQGATLLGQCADTSDIIEALLTICQNVASEMVRGTSQASILQSIDEMRPTMLHRGSSIDSALLQYAITGSHENLMALLQLAGSPM